MLRKITIIYLTFIYYTQVNAQISSQKQQFLLFWRSDCEVCHIAIPQLVKKIERLDSNKFTITAISFDTDSSNYYKAVKELSMQNFVLKYNFKEGYAGNQLAKKYHITKTPTLIYINEQGDMLAEGNEAFKILSGFKN